jgi:hypothetical protein
MLDVSPIMTMYNENLGSGKTSISKTIREINDSKERLASSIHPLVFLASSFFPSFFILFIPSSKFLSLVCRASIQQLHSCSNCFSLMFGIHLAFHIVHFLPSYLSRLETSLMPIIFLLKPQILALFFVGFTNHFATASKAFSHTSIFCDVSGKSKNSTYKLWFGGARHGCKRGKLGHDSRS